MVCLVLHAPIGLVPLQAGELVGRTHWGHKVCSSDKSEKKGVEKWCISTENCSNIANVFSVFGMLSIYVLLLMYFCWQILSSLYLCWCIFVDILQANLCQQSYFGTDLFKPWWRMFSVGKGISKNANDTNQECSEIAKNEKSKYKKVHEILI